MGGSYVHAGATHPFGWITVTHVSRDKATAEAALLADEAGALKPRSKEKTDAVGKLRAQLKKNTVAAATTTQKESWAGQRGSKVGGGKDRGSTEGRDPPRGSPAKSSVQNKHKSNQQPQENKVKEAQQGRSRLQKKAAVPTFKRQMTKANPMDDIKKDIHQRQQMQPSKHASHKMRNYKAKSKETENAKKCRKQQGKM